MRYIIYCINFFLIGNCFSQTVNLNFKNYNTESGLPENVVRSVIQDNQKFIWAGTEDGLARYDGYDFFVLKNNTPPFNISWNHIKDIKEDSSSKLLWVTNSKEVLDIIDPVKGTSFNIQTVQKGAMKFTDKFIWFILFGAGKAWAISESTIYIIDKNSYQLQKTIPFQKKGSGAAKLYIPFIYDNKYLVVFDETGNCHLINLSTGELESYLTAPELFTEARQPGFRVYYAGAGIRNKYHISSSAGIYAIDNISPFKISRVPKSELNIPDSLLHFETCITDIYNNVWLGVEDKGIAVVNNNNQVFFNKPFTGNLAVSDFNFWNIITDRQNQVWISTNFGLNYQAPYLPAFKTYSVDKTGPAMFRVFALKIINDSLLIVGGYNQVHLLDIKHSKIIPVINQTGEQLERFYTFTQTGEKEWAAGCKKGVLEIINKENNWYIKKYDRQAAISRLDYKRVSAIYPSGRGKYITGNLDKAGLYIWNKTENTLTLPDAEPALQKKLSGVTVNQVRPSSDGDGAWILTNGGVFLLKNDRIVKELNIPDTIKNETLNDLIEKKGVLWIVVLQKGLLKFDLKEEKCSYYNEKQGLKSTSAYNIADAGNNKLWLTTANGLCLFDISKEKFIVFGPEDGTQGAEYNRFAIDETKKSLVVGGMNGLTLVDKSGDISNISYPKVNISRISEFKKGIETTKQLSGIGKIMFEKNTTHFRVYFSTLSFTTINKTSYEFRLKGRDKEWNNTGGQNFIDFYNLPPGDYELLIRASGNIFEGNVPVTAVRFFIPPKWYQTWWFKFIAVLIILTFIYAFYKMRINQVRKEGKIRNQFATDLHDDLGSTLNSIKVHSNLALMEKENTEHLQHVKQGAQDAISGVRDIIWVLDDKKDRVSDMLARVGQFARPLCEGHNIRYTVLVDDETAAAILGKEEKRNLYMIIKEFINNSIKYAQCRNITVNIERTGKQLTVMVSDDGAGFDAGSATAGNGLRNMAARAAAIHYRYSIISEKSKGTRIILGRK